MDKADAVLQMDGELQAQQVQQHPQQPGVAASSTSEPSEAGASEAAAGGAGEGRAPQAPSLSRSDTGLSGAGSGSAGALGRAEPGSGSSSLPPGLGSVSRLESFASDQGSPRAATAAGAPSVYVSAAPSVQLDGGDADVAVLLEVMSEGRVQLSILLPAAAVLEGEDEDASDVELPEELAGVGSDACSGWGRAPCAAAPHALACLLACPVFRPRPPTCRASAPPPLSCPTGPHRCCTTCCLPPLPPQATSWRLSSTW